jgi:hypothetical protein
MYAQNRQNLQSLNNVIIDKTKVLLPPALCPIVDEEDK